MGVAEVIKTYRDLIVWQKAKKLAVEVYKQTESFPEREKFSITQQIRRASVSVPANIAEGYGRRTTNEYKRFLNIAMGSLYETQTLLEISVELDFLGKEPFDDFYEKSREIERVLSALYQKLS